ncbi:DNA damage-regulated autophagy modulator protein 2, partial [Zootermopsis nevadensis]
YTIAVLNEHVDPAFPYISDTGSYSPESCIFGQLVNIAAFIIAICVYIKYLEVKNFQQTITSKGGISHRFNKVTSAFGLLSCIGMDIVANFQESNVIVVHLLGAILCFGAGTIYFSLQLWISYKVPGLTSKRLLLTRAILVGICILTTISTVVTATLALSEYRGSTNNPQKWNPEDGGWELHLVSTISEWILVITYCILILSFVPEFYDLEFEAPVITFKNKRTFT